MVHARKNLLPVRDRIVFIKDGQEFLPGVQAIAAPGHTVGHTIFMVTSAGKSFAFLGDLSHHAVLLLEKPRMEFSFDTDPKQAAATRVKLLDMLAANKTAGHVLSLRLAGLWPRRQDRRRLPLLSRADEDAALSAARPGLATAGPGTAGPERSMRRRGRARGPLRRCVRTSCSRNVLAHCSRFRYP